MLQYSKMINLISGYCGKHFHQKYKLHGGIPQGNDNKISRSTENEWVNRTHLKFQNY